MLRLIKKFLSGWRITAVISIFALAYFFLVFNLYNIQFNKNAFYEAQAESQQKATGALDPIRGSIYFTDKNNNSIPVVLNKEFQLIYAVPKEIKDSQSAALLIGKILNLSVDELENKLNKPNDLFESLLFKASQEQVEEVNDLGIKGIYIKKQISRFYPHGVLASHLIGFVSPSDEKKSDDALNIKGRYGIELFFEDKLAGVIGQLEGDKITYPTDGENISLTIDRNIQAQAEEILKKLVIDKEAVGGSVIVQDPKTGKILAMGSYPDFDPNNYSESSVKNFLNPVIQAVYEPGSVFKIVTMAAGIDSGKITPETTYVDQGYAIINGRRIENWDHKVHGKLSMTNVIEQSINTGTIFAEKQMGHDIFKNYLYKFGLNELTGIKLPGELRGNLANLNNGREVNYATASYGQGVAVTPIEMISAVSAIANGGVLMKPLILSNDNPEVVRRVISQDTSKKVTQMMVSAVKKNIIADIPNYQIAGKTGTAFVPNFQTGGYTDEVINTYVGYAPAFDPKFSVLIKLEKPKNAPLAGQTVVPAFRELAGFILNYYNVTPDNI